MSVLGLIRLEASEAFGWSAEIATPRLMLVLIMAAENASLATVSNANFVAEIAAALMQQRGEVLLQLAESYVWHK